MGFIVLLYGRGGFGKSTLLRRYRDIALKENQDAFFSKITVSDVVDWEFAIEGRRSLFNPPKGQEIDAVDYLKLVCSRLALALAKKPQEFKRSQLAFKELEKLKKDANEVLNRMQKDEHYTSLRALAGPGAMILLRWISPRIGQTLDSAKITAKVEEVIGKGADLGAEQLIQLHSKLKDKLGSKLTDYLEPELRLGLALGEDLREFARNFPLLIFFDTYEEIDEGDHLLRTVMAAAGLRVGWVLAGRDNLWGGPEQRARSTALEYSYKDIVPPDRILPIDLNVGGGGAFTIADIVKYFAQMRKTVRYKPPLPAVTEEDAARILDLTQGVPLAVKVAAGLYVETSDLSIVTAKTESKRKIVDELVRRYLLHTRDDQSDRSRLYGLALLRRADNAIAIASALQLTPEQTETSYASELSRLHRRYSFIFAEKEQPLLHQEVRYFIRLWMLEHRKLPEIVSVSERLKEVQEATFKKLEERRQYSSLRERLEDDEWVGLYLDLAEQFFWLDPVEGVDYILPFMLAAAIYRRDSNQDAIEIGKFFDKEIPQPYRRRWAWAMQSLYRVTSYNPSRDEFSSLQELEKLIHQRCPHFLLSFLPDNFQKELRGSFLLATWRSPRGKNVEKALKYYEMALNQLRNDEEFREATAEAANRVAIKLIDEKNSKEGVLILDRAIELSPKISFLYYNRGLTHVKLEKYQEAIPDFDYAIELNPSFASSYNARGNALLNLYEYEKAIVDYNRAIELEREEPAGYYNRGRAYDKLKEYQRAIADFTNAVELDFRRGSVRNKKLLKGATYLARGRVYSKLKDYQLAITDYKNALGSYDQINEVRSQKAETYLARGQAYVKLGMYQDAIADFNTVINLDPEYNHVGYKNKGLALYALQRYQEAINTFYKALQVGAGCDECLNSLAKAHKALHSIDEPTSVQIGTIEKDYQLIIDDYSHIIKLNPTDINSIINRGATYLLTLRFQAALADINCALELDSNNKAAVLCRIAIFYSIGNYLEALADIDRLLRIKGINKEELRSKRALILNYLERYDEFIEEFKQLLKNDPDDVDDLYNLAVAANLLKRDAASQIYFDKARATLLLDILNSENHGSALYGLGGLEAITGATEQALNHLQEAIKIENFAVVWASHDPAWKSLHSNPDFLKIISTNIT